MPQPVNRRDFLRASAGVAAGAAAAAVALTPTWAAASLAAKPLYEISLAEWSLHRMLFDKKLDHLEFAATTKNEFDIHAVEYVNQFFKDKAKDAKYIAELKKRADDIQVRGLLIMIDGEGALGDADEKARKTAVENHYKWVEAAKALGCHSIRVNAASSGTYDEQVERAADGLRRLTEFAITHNINVIVENHGGLSSNGAWLAKTISKVGLSQCGTLPDFGNFRISEKEQYDRYTGVKELMPFAKAVSAKSHDFDEMGNEIHTDYRKMMKIVVDAGYTGFVGIEYEGSKISEFEGIKATKKLLEVVREELSKKA